MSLRSGGVHPLPNTVIRNAVGTAAVGISQLGNDAIYE